MLQTQAEALEALRARHRDGGKKDGDKQGSEHARLTVSPFSVIRVNDAYIGDMGVYRASPADSDASLSLEERRAMRAAAQSGEGEGGRGKRGWQVAYSLDPAWWGQGIAGAVVGVVLEWVRGEIGVGEVEAVSPDEGRMTLREGGDGAMRGSGRWRWGEGWTRLTPDRPD